MKTLLLSFASLLFITQTLKAQQNSSQRDQVSVAVKNSEEVVSLDAIDLAGGWVSVLSTAPIVGKTQERWINLTQGHQVIIYDNWIEDYPGRMRNCTWTIIDQQLYFNSPDLGKVKIDVEKLQHGNYYEFMINNVTYRKLVNTSRSKSGKRKM